MSNGNGLKETLLREGHDASHLELSAAKNKRMMDNGYMHKVVEIKMGADEPKACRFWGSIPLHKVAGKVRITGDKMGLGPLGAIMGFLGGMGGMGGMPGMGDMFGMGMQPTTNYRFI